MKLFFCPLCHDIVKMIEGDMRHCKCGKSGGMYTDSVMAEIEGHAIPIGIDNNELVTAIQIKSPNLICKFTAFIMPADAEHHIIKQPMCQACRQDGISMLKPITHPENSESPNGREGYQVYECEVCKEIWGCRHQWDPGCGSDNRWKAFGKDATKVKRHY